VPTSELAAGQAAEAAVGLLAPHIYGRRSAGLHGELAVSFTGLPAALGPLVAAVAGPVLVGAVIAARTARETMTGLYQAQGPVSVSIPLLPARFSHAEATAW
jgi:hypothetical protein